MDIGQAIGIVIFSGVLGVIASVIIFKWKLITKMVVPIAYVAMVVGSIGLYMGRGDYSPGISAIIALSAVIFLLLTLAFYFNYFLIKPFKQVQEVLVHLSKGDLTKTIIVKTEDELQEMAEGINDVSSHLKLLINKIKQGAQDNSDLANTLSESVQTVNASSQEVAKTVQEIAKRADFLNKNAVDATNSSREAQSIAMKGSSSAQTVQSQMDAIKQRTADGAERIRTLAQKSQEIDAIIETINSIAEQTNLLSLNAAIEAARAGDAGKGFAVVADEVRKLAEESQKATSRIKDIISLIQTEIENSVVTMDLTANEVKDSTSSVTEALISFEQIPVIVNKVDESISEVSKTAELSASGAEEVNASVEEVNAIIQKVAQSSQELTKTATELRILTEPFKTK